MSGPAYAKRSAQIAWLADAAGERCVAGWEEGGDEPTGLPSPSPRPPRNPPLDLPTEGRAAEARRWRTAFAAATGLPADEVAVRRGVALVEERAGAATTTRRIESAQLLLGGSPAAPRLARTLLVEAGAHPPRETLDAERIEDAAVQRREALDAERIEDAAVQRREALDAERLGEEAIQRRETLDAERLGEDAAPPRQAIDAERVEDNAAPSRETLDAARRETAGWDEGLPTIDAAALCRTGRPLVLDLFAWTDLVRTAAFAWEAGPRALRTVASLPFDAADPGLPFPLAPSGRDADAGRCAEGGRAGVRLEPRCGVQGGDGPREEPRILVRAGRLVPSAPAISRPSWRRPAVPGLRALETGVRLQAEWPADAVVVTAALILPGTTLMRGIALEGGRPAARFSWTAAAAPGAWPRRVVAALGAPVWDLTGLPTRASAVLVDGRRGVLGN